MALQTSVTIHRIIEVPAAYARVATFAGDKIHCVYCVHVHASAEARAQGDDPIKEHAFSFSMLAPVGDILPACYADLKTRPGFETAQDV